MRNLALNSQDATLFPDEELGRIAATYQRDIRTVMFEKGRSNGIFLATAAGWLSGDHGP